MLMREAALLYDIGTAMLRDSRAMQTPRAANHVSWRSLAIALVWAIAGVSSGSEAGDLRRQIGKEVKHVSGLDGTVPFSMFLEIIIDVTKGKCSFEGMRRLRRQLGLPVVSVFVERGSFLFAKTPQSRKFREDSGKATSKLKTTFSKSHRPARSTKVSGW
jgi:hypothetical protein